jgi:hypothetical protein
VTSVAAQMRAQWASLLPPPVSDEEPSYRRLARESAEFVERAGSAGDPTGWSQFDPTAAWWPERRPWRNWPIPFDDYNWCLLTSYDAGHHQLALTGEQCDRILGLVDDPEAQRLFGPERDGPSASRHIPLPEFPDIHEPPEGLWEPLTPLFAAAVAANEAWWGFEVSRVRGRLLMYDRGSGFLRHTDVRAGYATAKLAASVQLSHGDDYRGGDLVLYPEGNWQPSNGRDRGEWRLSRARGSVCVHPSWVGHEVRPVTRGRRWSATLIVHGDRPFR